MKRYAQLTAIGLSLSLLASTAAHAQSGAKQDSIGEDAVDAVTQPLSDLNLRSKEIPLILTLAQEEPYNLTEVVGCEAVLGEIARLDSVLGPDANEPAQRKGLVNRGLQVGGDVLGGMIPFRGLVRRISGARAEKKRWEAAVYAGVARRSFLKGYLAGQACEAPREEEPESARDVLGLTPTTSGN